MPWRWMQLSPRLNLASLRGAAAGPGTLTAMRLPVSAIVVGRAGEDAARHLSLADRLGARLVLKHQFVLAGHALQARLLQVARADPDAMSAGPSFSEQVLSIRPII